MIGVCTKTVRLVLVHFGVGRLGGMEARNRQEYHLKGSLMEHQHDHEMVDFEDPERCKTRCQSVLEET